MKTKDAIELAGSAAALSRLLNITQSAVSQWGEFVPSLQAYRLKEIKPKWFKRRTVASQTISSAQAA